MALINDTTDYHRNHLSTLGWELTVCNAMEIAESPIYDILVNHENFGAQLFAHLSNYFPIEQGGKLLEIGGGYGFLMRDIIARCEKLEASMIELSPTLLAIQKETLKNNTVIFHEGDALDFNEQFFTQYDFVIINEIVGDLPTIVGYDGHTEGTYSSHSESGPILNQIKEKHAEYLMMNNLINVNIGALMLLNKLCKSKVPYIYISEHSCEIKSFNAITGEIVRDTNLQPYRIQLAGHDEYSIKFSDLEFLAHAYNYEVLRGSYSDFILFSMTDELRYVITGNSEKEKHEIMRHFIEDLFGYEYLIIKKRD